MVVGEGPLLSWGGGGRGVRGGRNSLPVPSEVRSPAVGPSEVEQKPELGRHCQRNNDVILHPPVLIVWGVWIGGASPLRQPVAWMWDV